jgi:hypothetical protein
MKPDAGSTTTPLATPPRWRAFADGCGGGLLGGVVYCLLVSYFQPSGLHAAWLRVAGLALVLGAVETWRVAHKIHLPKGN